MVHGILPPHSTSPERIEHIQLDVKYVTGARPSSSTKQKRSICEYTWPMSLLRLPFLLCAACAGTYRAMQGWISGYCLALLNAELALASELLQRHVIADESWVINYTYNFLVSLAFYTCIDECIMWLLHGCIGTLLVYFKATWPGWSRWTVLRAKIAIT